MMSWTDLKERVGSTKADDEAFIQFCWTSAVILVTDVFANAFRPVPESIVDLVTLEVGHALYERKKNPSGTSQYAVFDGGAVPVRAPRDPLQMIRPIITRYVVPF